MEGKIALQLVVVHTGTRELKIVLEVDSRKLRILKC